MKVKVILVTMAALNWIPAYAMNPCESLAIQSGFVEAAQDAYMININTTKGSILKKTTASQPFKPNIDIYLDSIIGKEIGKNIWKYEVLVKTKAPGSSVRSIYYAYTYSYRVDTAKAQVLCSLPHKEDLDNAPDEE